MNSSTKSSRYERKQPFSTLKAHSSHSMSVLNVVKQASHDELNFFIIFFINMPHRTIKHYRKIFQSQQR